MLAATRGRRAALLVAATLSLGACKSDPKEAQPAKAALDKPRSWDTTFTSERLGPLTASSKIDEATLRSSFPGADVARRVDSSEGDEFEVFEVTRAGEPVFRVYPASGALSAVEVYADEYRLDGAIAVGTPFEQLQTRLGDLECFGGAEENAGRAFCSSASEAGLVFVFPLHDPRSELYAAPLEGDKLAAVAGQAIEYIVWTPERAEP